MRKILILSLCVIGFYSFIISQDTGIRRKNSNVSLTNPRDTVTFGVAPDSIVQFLEGRLLEGKIPYLDTRMDSVINALLGIVISGMDTTVKVTPSSTGFMLFSDKAKLDMLTIPNIQTLGSMAGGDSTKYHGSESITQTSALVKAGTTDTLETKDDMRVYVSTHGGGLGTMGDADSISYHGGVNITQVGTVVKMGTTDTLEDKNSMREYVSTHGGGTGTSNGYAQPYDVKKIYVSSVYGVDADNDGHTIPIQSITKLNTLTLSAGDEVLFRSDESYEGQITIAQSGTPALPIKFSSYSTGAKPIIKGSVTLAGWVAKDANIWSCKAPSDVYNVFVDGVQQTLARTPNTGFYTIATTNGSTTITSASITQATGYWVGANVRYRYAYACGTGVVSAYNGTTLTFSAAIAGSPPTVGYGFYMDNLYTELDAATEWWCNTTTDSLYWYSADNPASHTIEAVVNNYGITSSGGKITINGLEFRQQAVAGICFTGTDSLVTIKNCIVRNQWKDGISFTGTTAHNTIDNTYFNHINGKGILFTNGTNNVVSRDTLKNIGEVWGYGTNGVNGMTGVCFLGGSYNTMWECYLDSIGYNGVRYDGMYNSIHHNIFTNIMMKLSDGGACYAYGENTRTAFDTIRNNYIKNVVGNATGMASGIPSSYGIYPDYQNNNIVIDSNTIIDVYSSGINVQYKDTNITIRANTIAGAYSHGIGIAQNKTLPYGYHVITNNIFIPDTLSWFGYPPWAITHQDVSGTYDLSKYATLDYNYYLTTYKTSLFYIIATNSTTMTLAQWQTATGKEANSSDEYNTAIVDGDSLFVNPTFGTVTKTLTHYYHDLDGVVVSGSITLHACDSRYLIKDQEVSVIVADTTDKSDGEVPTWDDAASQFVLAVPPGGGDVTTTQLADSMQAERAYNSGKFGTKDSLNARYTAVYTNTLLSNKVSTSVTVNGHPLSNNVTVTPGDLSLTIGTNTQAYHANLATLSSPTANRFYYSNASSAMTSLAFGADATLLSGNGTGAVPSWKSFTTLIPTIGDTTKYYKKYDSSDAVTGWYRRPMSLAMMRDTSYLLMQGIYAGIASRGGLGGSMVYPGAGITISTGSAWGTSWATTLFPTVADTANCGWKTKLWWEGGKIHTGNDSTGTGITSLNGIYDPSMTLALDTLATGAPSWTAAGSTVTLNLPFARFARLLNPSFTNMSVTFGSDATGDIFYRKADGWMGRLGIGSTGQRLGVSAGLPAWSASDTVGLGIALDLKRNRANPDTVGLGVALDLKMSRYTSRDIMVDTSYMRTANADTIRFFRTNRAIVVDSISISCEGVSVNMKVDFRFAYNAHGAGTALVNSPAAFTSCTNPNVITSFSTTAIPANRIVYFMMSDVTTRQNSLFTMYYH